MTDLHVHTRFCDGRDTPEELTLAAIEKGLDTLGFSGHAHTAFDEAWCMSREATALYRAEIARLKEKYRGQIRILCGLEMDLYSDDTAAEYDYAIGSVHYIQVEGNYVPVDESAELLAEAAAKYFGGDIYALAEEYFAQAAGVIDKTGADIIGHFDLITKFNEQKPLIDETNPRYRAAWQKAAERLIKTGRPFEVNTGAISRGYRTSPYPSREILGFIRGRGGKILLTSDCHDRRYLCWRFAECERLLKEIGFVKGDFAAF